MSDGFADLDDFALPDPPVAGPMGGAFDQAGIDALFGDADHHLGRIAAAPGLPQLA